MNALLLLLVAVLIVAAMIFRVIDQWRISPVRGVFMLIASLVFLYALGTMVSIAWPFIALVLEP